MKRSIRVFVLFISIISFLVFYSSFFITSVFACPAVIPVISSVRPQNAKPGQLVHIYGFFQQIIYLFYGNEKYGWKQLPLNYLSNTDLTFIAPQRKIPHSFIYLQTCGGDSLKYHFTITEYDNRRDIEINRHINKITR